MKAKRICMLGLWASIISGSLHIMAIPVEQPQEMDEESQHSQIAEFIDSLKTEQDMLKPMWPGARYPALLYLAQEGDHESVKKILEKKPPLEKMLTPLGENIFHILAENRDATLMRLVIKHCKQERIDYCTLINSETREYKDTPMHCAADSCATQCLKLLLKHGAQVDNKNSAGQTPLHVASEAEMRGSRKRNHAVDILCRARANIHAKDMDQKTAKEAARVKNHTTTVIFLEKFQEQIAKYPAFYQEHSTLKEVVQNRVPREVFHKIYEFKIGAELILPKSASENRSVSSL